MNEYSEQTSDPHERQAVIQTHATLSAPADILWYLQHRQVVRGYQATLQSMAHELESALTVSHFGGSRPDAHYIVVKWMFNDWNVLEYLANLLRLLPVPDSRPLPASLDTLRQVVAKALAHGRQHDNRSAYAQYEPWGEFQTLLAHIALQLEALRVETEETLLARLTPTEP